MPKPILWHAYETDTRTGARRRLTERPMAWAWCARLFENFKSSNSNNGVTIIDVEPEGGWRVIEHEPIMVILQAFRDGQLDMRGALQAIKQVGQCDPTDEL
jgi:hypothetical protein